jgi:RNA polymerase sigma factor (sigma-70 family)
MHGGGMDQGEWVDRLFRDHAKELYRYLRTFRLPEEDTYDLVQDAFAKLLVTEPSSIRRPKVWLFSVGRNLAINLLKRNRTSRVGGADPDSVPDGSPGALCGLLDREERSRLWQAFLALPARDREMMELYLEQGFSYRQIGSVTGRSEIAVRVAMHRCRRQMRQRANPGEALAREAAANEGAR